MWEYENKAIGFDLGPVLIVEDVSSEEDREERDLAGRFVGCSIEVEDIQATYSELVAKGVHFTAPPEKQEWGGHTLRISRTPQEMFLPWWAEGGHVSLLGMACSSK